MKTGKNSKISYRTVEGKDRPFLLHLYAGTRYDVHEHMINVTPEQKDEFIRMQFEAQDAHYQKHYPDAQFLIIQHRKKDVGRLYMEEWPSQIRVMDITIDDSYRGKGIGETVMLEVIKKAEKKGKSTSIHVAKDNRALNLYHRLGFEIDGGTDVYHLMVKRVTDQKTNEENHRPKEAEILDN